MSFLDEIGSKLVQLEKKSRVAAKEPEFTLIEAKIVKFCTEPRVSSSIIELFPARPYNILGIVQSLVKRGILLSCTNKYVANLEHRDFNVVMTMTANKKADVDDSFDWRAMDYNEKLTLVRESGLPDAVAGKELGVLSQKEIDKLKHSMYMRKITSDTSSDIATTWENADDLQREELLKAVNITSDYIRQYSAIDSFDLLPIWLQDALNYEKKASILPQDETLWKNEIKDTVATLKADNITFKDAQEMTDYLVGDKGDLTVEQKEYASQLYNESANVTAEKKTAGEIESDELFLYIENDGQLYERVFMPIIKNLTKKKKNNTYDSELAVKAFAYLAEEGAKKYVKDFGGIWNTMFDVPTRKQVATDFRDKFECLYENKEYDFMKDATKQASAYTDFVGKYMKENEGSSIGDAAKAWSKQKGKSDDKTDDKSKDKAKEPKKEVKEDKSTKTKKDVIRDKEKVEKKADISDIKVIDINDASEEQATNFYEYPSFKIFDDNHIYLIAEYQLIIDNGVKYIITDEVAVVNTKLQDGSLELDWETSAYNLDNREKKADYDSDEDNDANRTDEEPMPEDGDYVLSDSDRLGSKISVNVVNGDSLGEFDDEDEAMIAIKEDMELNKFWPNVWYKDDHGGLSLRTASIKTASPEVSVGDVVKIDMNVVKKRDNMPPYIRLVNQAIKNAENGMPYIAEINDNFVYIRAWQFDLLGDVRVPKEAIVYSKKASIKIAESKYNITGEVYSVAMELEDTGVPSSDIDKNWYEYRLFAEDKETGRLVGEWDSRYETYNPGQELTKEEAEQALADVLEDAKANPEEFFNIRNSIKKAAKGYDFSVVNTDGFEDSVIKTLSPFGQVNYEEEGVEEGGSVLEIGVLDVPADKLIDFAKTVESLGASIWSVAKGNWGVFAENHGDLTPTEFVTQVVGAKEASVKKVMYSKNKAVNSYLETALWSSNAPEELGLENLDELFTVSYFSAEAVERAEKDWEAFEKKAWDLLNGLELDLEQVAHDFWLTRNHHGAGFWDGDYEEEVGEKLTEISHEFGEIDVEVGDDGQLYLQGGKEASNKKADSSDEAERTYKLVLKDNPPQNARGVIYDMIAIWRELEDDWEEIEERLIQFKKVHPELTTAIDSELKSISGSKKKAAIDKTDLVLELLKGGLSNEKIKEVLLKIEEQEEKENQEASKKKADNFTTEKEARFLAGEIKNLVGNSVYVQVYPYNFGRNWQILLILREQDKTLVIKNTENWETIKNYILSIIDSEKEASTKKADDEKKFFIIESYSGEDSEKILDLLDRDMTTYKKVGPKITIFLDRNSLAAATLLAELRRISKFDEIKEASVKKADDRPIGEEIKILPKDIKELSKTKFIPREEQLTAKEANDVLKELYKSVVELSSQIAVDEAEIKRVAAEMKKSKEIDPAKALLRESIEKLTQMLDESGKIVTINAEKVLKLVETSEEVPILSETVLAKLEEMRAKHRQIEQEYEDAAGAQMKYIKKTITQELKVMPLRANKTAISIKEIFSKIKNFFTSWMSEAKDFGKELDAISW